MGGLSPSLTLSSPYMALLSGIFVLAFIYKTKYRKPEKILPPKEFEWLFKELYPSPPRSCLKMIDNDMICAYTSFAISYFQSATHSHTQKSFVCSPLSLGFALAMLNEGARGETRRQICKALGEDASPSSIRFFFSLLSSVLSEGVPSVESTVANAIYINKDLPIESSFVDKAMKYFHALVKHIDFESGDAAAKEVNDYVLDRTKGLIKNIVSAHDFSSLTHSFIVNTIFFQGRWSTAFTKSETKLRTFYGLHGNREEQFMYAHFDTKRAHFSIDDSLTTIALPYTTKNTPKAGNYNFVVFMPSREFCEWKKSLTTEKMTNAIRGMKRHSAFVYMPKFNMESTVDAMSTLKKVGVSDVFDGSRADLSGICRMGPLFVDRIIQKVTIEVDEDGTRATAVTASGDRFLGGSYAVPTTIRLDRPFVFAIMRDDIPLFVGMYV